MMLSIVIPVFNEEKSIGKLLADLKKCYIPIEYEIIIVDDSSEDCTEDIILHEREKNRSILLINRKGKRGLGRSLKKGFEEARGDIIVVVMGDLVDDLNDIPLMLRQICERGYDFVCASRYMKGGHARHNNIIKGFFPKFLGKVIHLYTGVPTLDSANSYKMFRKEILSSVRPIESDYFTLGLELLLKAYKKGFKIIEIPTIWHDRQVGRTQFNFLRDGFYYLRWFLFALKIK